MSSVLNRFKGASDFQLVTDARTLRGELISWINNPKHLPKKYRWVFLTPLCTNLNDMVEELKLAQKEFPHDNETLEKRRKHIENAMNSNLTVWRILQSLYDTRKASGGMSLKALEHHLDKLYELYVQMKAWKRAGIPKRK